VSAEPRPVTLGADRESDESPQAPVEPIAASATPSGRKVARGRGSQQQRRQLELRIWALEDQIAALRQKCERPVNYLERLLRGLQDRSVSDEPGVQEAIENGQAAVAYLRQVLDDEGATGAKARPPRTPVQSSTPS
jgi:hypothetical protein